MKGEHRYLDIVHIGQIRFYGNYCFESSLNRIGRMISFSSANRNANCVRNTVTGLKAQTNNLESVGMIGKRNRSQMTEKEYIELLKAETDEYVRLDELSYL